MKCTNQQHLHTFIISLLLLTSTMWVASSCFYMLIVWVHQRLHMRSSTLCLQKAPKVGQDAHEKFTAFVSQHKICITPGLEYLTSHRVTFMTLSKATGVDCPVKLLEHKWHGHMLTFEGMKWQISEICISYNIFLRAVGLSAMMSYDAISWPYGTQNHVVIAL